MRSKQESLTAEAYNYDALTVICVTESVSARGDPSAVTQTVSSALQTHYSKYGWSLWESVTDVLLCPPSYRAKREQNLTSGAFAQNRGSVLGSTVA